MALNLQNKYPGRFDPVSADYPQGKFKNRSSPTAQDGSYMERDWLNDWAGFFGAMMSSASVVPNGTVDTARSSQLYDALWAVIMKSLPKRSFGDNDFIRIPDVPGGLIIQWGQITIPSKGLWTFPTVFPNSILGFAAIHGPAATGVLSASVSDANNSRIQILHNGEYNGFRCLSWGF